MDRVIAIILLLSTVHGSSFVPSIGHQWPWFQWTSTTPPPPSTETPSSSGQSNWHPNLPPPAVTPLPPLDSTNYVIVTDPSDGRIFYIPANLFWSRFPGLGGSAVNQPPLSDPYLCDVSSPKCWQSRTPSQGTGVRQSGYYKPPGSSNVIVTPQKERENQPRDYDDGTSSGGNVNARWDQGAYADQEANFYPWQSATRTEGTGIGGSGMSTRLQQYKKRMST